MLKLYDTNGEECKNKEHDMLAHGRDTFTDNAC